MKTLMAIWKEFALKMPAAYLFSCWILLGACGELLGVREELTGLFILFIGYFINIIWMMRISK